jgi:apolipoprotein N-acyltransferase
VIGNHELDVPNAAACFNHPQRETMVRCGKCGRPICVRCMVSTPVGMRCRECAQLRRLPQFDVDARLLAGSAAGGLAASTLVWLLITYVPYLSFFAAIAVGFAVAAAMSPLAKRRTSRPLEVAAVIAVAGGFFIAHFARFALLGGLPFDLHGATISIVLPLALASFVAVVRLR